MKRLPIVTDYEICTACGGACCSSMPGALWPADVWKDGAPDWKKIEEMLRSGKYAVDWWEGDGRGYYLRPAVAGDEGRVLDPSWGGACTFLTDSGCSLSARARPSVCRQLKPLKSGGCRLKFDGATNAKDYTRQLWAPFSSALFEIADKIEGESDG